MKKSISFLSSKKVILDDNSLMKLEAKTTYSKVEEININKYFKKIPWELFQENLEVKN